MHLIRRDCFIQRWHKTVYMNGGLSAGFVKEMKDHLGSRAGSDADYVDTSL